jgi:signal transduction histidine kinase
VGTAAEPRAGPTALDWVIAASAGALTWMRLSVGPGVHASVLVDSAAGVLAAAAGLVLAWRRRRPGIVAAAVVTACAAAAVVAGPFLPVAGWVAVVAVARHVRGVKAALGGAAAAAIGIAAGAVVGALVHDLPQGLYPVLQLTLLMLLAAALVRLQSARVQAQRREREAERGRAATAERLRIARDLHDLVGHGLSTIAVQSSTARLAMDAGDTVTAGRALAAVEQASRGALAEMRQMLGVLRQDTADVAPAPGLAGIDGLADDARAVGAPVSVHRSGPLGAVPPAIGLCAYRVVQEAVTNAIRHAPRAAISIRLQAAGGVLMVEVLDEGVAAGGTGWSAETAGSGDRPRYGLAGLRERVAAAGGTVEAGPRPDRPGWRVAARLPLTEVRTASQTETPTETQTEGSVS